MVSALASWTRGASFSLRQQPRRVFIATAVATRILNGLSWDLEGWAWYCTKGPLHWQASERRKYNKSHGILRQTERLYGSSPESTCLTHQKIEFKLMQPHLVVQVVSPSWFSVQALTFNVQHLQTIVINSRRSSSVRPELSTCSIVPLRPVDVRTRVYN